jgi:hypothetical protein
MAILGSIQSFLPYLSLMIPNLCRNERMARLIPYLRSWGIQCERFLPEKNNTESILITQLQQYAKHKKPFVIHIMEYEIKIISMYTVL